MHLKNVSSDSLPHPLHFMNGLFDDLSNVSPFFQVTVYLGKRDFVDHITSVDVIGMYFSLLVFTFEF